MALHGLLGISVDSTGLQLQARVPTRRHGTDLFVRKAINNSVMKVFKYPSQVIGASYTTAKPVTILHV